MPLAWKDFAKSSFLCPTAQKPPQMHTKDCKLGIMYRNGAEHRPVLPPFLNRGCFSVGEKPGMNKNMNFICLEQTFRDSTTWNGGACKAHSAQRDKQEAEHKVTAWRDISCTAHSVPTGSSTGALGHLLPSGTCPTSRPRPAVPGATAPAGGCRGLQTVFTWKHWEREHGCAKEMPDLPDGIHLPNLKGQETWQMLLWNTQRASNTHHCCFPQRSEGTDLITHKLS